ncbi:methyl-accepting chemotaxis protein [Tistrella mobilis]|uniref:methyl-accepting chemotaxis protein n=1 Tax=Tistrella mobilis TaxID=171437 RepID=UPI003558EEB0
MSRSSSIRTRLTWSSLVSALLIAAAGGAGILGLVRSDDGLSAVTRVTAAVRQQMQGDMMHDALRADVLMALRLAPDAPAADRAAVAADLAEHADIFRTAMHTLRDLDVSPAIAAQLPAVAAAVDAYVRAAETIVSAAGRDRAAAEAGFPAFLDAFGDLETRMGTLGDEIEAISGTVAAEAQADNARLMTILLVTAGFATLLVLSVSLIIGRDAGRSIDRMAQRMTALAAGDTTSEVPGTGRRDEIGRMAQAVEVFRNTALSNDRLTAERAEETTRRERRTAEIETACRRFDHEVSEALRQVIAAVAGMEGTAREMRGLADAATSDAGEVGRVSEVSAANVKAAAEAAEALAASIADIGRETARSGGLAADAARQAREANAQITTLADAASRIGQVVGLISEIAEQTNLLALNATIEAARAGDAGKGFAVVASEVKQLADQTARATAEIAERIGGIQSETGRVVTVIGRIGTTIGEIDGITATVAAAVQRQGSATHEIAGRVDQAAAGSRDVSAGLARVTGAVRRTGDQAAALQQVTDDLATRARGLKGQVEGFLGTVRTA